MGKYNSYIIAAFIISTIISSILLGISLIFSFIASIAFSVFILSRQGHLVKHLLGMVWNGVFECRVLYLFILLIGANISVWMASGIVPAMMYYGFEYLKGTNFIFVAFLITGGMSVFMGTAVGTISTLGIALLGIGRGFQIPQGLLLGVLVSGAFIADKISPISGLLNLTLKVTDTTYRQVLKTMARTLVPVLALTAAVYYFIGRGFSGEDAYLIQSYQQALTNGFELSPLLLLLPLGVVLLPLKGVKIVPTILVGLVGGMVLALTVQGTNFLDLLDYILWGYKASSQSQELNSILISGGVWGMMEVVLIVISVIGLSSVLEKSGVLKPLIFDPIARVRAKGALILKTGIIGIMLTLVSCDQTVGIVIQGKMYKNIYTGLGVDKEILARTISDTSTIVAPLIPWNINALIIASVTGVSALEYGPYAILCYLFPLTIGWIYLGQHRQQREVESGEGSNSAAT